MLEEQFAVLHGLWGEPDGWSFDGAHVTIEDAEFHPKPVARPGRPVAPNGAPGRGSSPVARVAAVVPDRRALRRRVQPVVVVAGDGARRSSPSCDAACQAIGRDPATMASSVMAGVLIGRDEAELARRKTALLAAFGDEAGGEDWFDAREPRWVLGTPDQARAMVAPVRGGGRGAADAPGLPARATST